MLNDGYALDEKCNSFYNVYRTIQRERAGNMDIISEIKKLPNLGYEYFKDNGMPCTVVLGGASCPPSDEYRFRQNITQYNLKLIELYESKPFAEDTKERIAYYMKKMRSACDTRMAGTYTLQQQAAYIDALSDGEREQIEAQVLMYKECYTIYLENVRRR